MLRAFALYSKRFLYPRPLPIYTLSAEAASTTALYDVQRHRVPEHPRTLHPLAFDHKRQPLLSYNTPLLNNVRWASEEKKKKHGANFKVPNPAEITCNMINMLKCVDLQHMKDSPPPAFWVALGVGGTQIILPLLELIGGYSDTLTIHQLHLAALTVALLGGVKWGLAVSKNPVPTPDWDTMIAVGIPSYITLLGLALPYPIGFLAVAGAVVSTLYLDLKSCAFPAWGNAIRLFLTLTTLVGLTMALMAYLLFHSSENEKAKEKKKDGKKKDDKALEDDEENEDDKSKKGDKKTQDKDK